MRILLTGIAGTIGQRVARELIDHGYQIRGVDNRLLPEDLRSAVEMRYVDITNPLDMLMVAEGCEAIIHTAAYPNPMMVTSSELLRVNVIGTQNILDAARAHHIKRVILTSSVAALGFSFPTHPCPPDYLPIDVAHPRRPQDIYGVSKVMNEESAHAMTRLSGMTTIVIRPPFVLDVAQAVNWGWFHKGWNRTKEALKTLWAYIDFKDLSRAYRLALEASIEGHHLFYAFANDVSAKASLMELAERHYPNLVDMVGKLTGNSFYDLTPARDLLGFESQITWRSISKSDT